MLRNKFQPKNIVFYSVIFAIVIIVFLLVDLKEIQRLEENLNLKVKNNVELKENRHFIEDSKHKLRENRRSVRDSGPELRGNRRSVRDSDRKFVNLSSKRERFLDRRIAVNSDVNDVKQSVPITSKDAYVIYDKFIRHKLMVDEITSKYIILPSKECDNETKLVVLVNSKTTSSSARSSIRSYMKARPSIKIFFLVGHETMTENNESLNTAKKSNKNALPKTSVSLEADLKNDMIVPDVWDNYSSLTVKTAMGFLWVLKYCPQAERVLKMDDDVYINMKLLEASLENQPPLSILGKICTTCIPFNPGGVAESENIITYDFVVTRNHLPLSRLPSFVFGPAYVVSTSLLPALLVTGLQKDFLPYYEDLFWTGLTTADLRTKLQEDDFQLLDQISLLKLEHRNNEQIKEILDFLENICSKQDLKFAQTSQTLSLMKLIDVPSWRIEVHKCFEGKNFLPFCLNFTTFHGFRWNEKAVNHLIN